MGFLHFFTGPEEDRQVGRNIGGLENVSYLHLCFLYIYIYIYIYNCRQYCFGLLGLISFFVFKANGRAPGGEGAMPARHDDKTP